MFFILRLSLLLSSLMLPSICMALNAVTSRSTYYDLPAQTLAAGLIEFALQARVTVIVEDTLVANLRSHPVSGRLPVEAALAQLLTNTQLTFSFQPHTGAYLIQVAPQVIAPAAAPIEPPHNAPIEEIVVVGYLTYPFRYTTVSNSQQQANVSYFDSVRFANVLPQQLLADQQTEDFAEVLKYASGVMPADGLSDTNDDIYIRGFHRGTVFLDGYRIGDTTGLKLMPANIERVEILKGPATILYGQAEPGGTLNFISKKPTDADFLHGEIAAGTLGKTRFTLDANQHAGTVNTRLIVADQAQQEAGDIREIHRQLLSPALSWQPNDQSQFDLQYHWQHNSQLSSPNTATSNSPSTSSVADSSFYQPYPGRSPLFDARFQFINAHYHYDLNPSWKIGLNLGHLSENRQGVRTSSDTLTNSDVLLGNQPVGQEIVIIPLGGRVAAPLTVRRNGDDWTFVVEPIHSLFGESAEETAEHAAIHLNGTTQIAGMEHKLSLGIDWRQQDLYKEYRTEVNDWYPARVWNIANFNAVINDLSNRLFAIDRPLGQLQQQTSQLTSDDKGLFLSDSVTLNENWIASLGSRFSEITAELNYFNPANGDANTQARGEYSLPNYHNFSSQFGLVYKPSEANSWYFNYSEAMRANYRVDAPDAKNAQPETSSQFEIGLKSLLLDGRLLSSLGLYQISKNNISELVSKRGELNSLSFSDQSVKGIDLDLTWQINAKIDVLAGFARLDPIVESGKHKGKKPADIAEKSATLFVHYRVSSHWASDLGISYLGPRFGSTLGDKLDVLGQKARLPEYTTVDAHLTYQHLFWNKPWEFKLSVKNATDKQYYTAFVAGVRPNIAEGRSILGIVRFTY